METGTNKPAAGGASKARQDFVSSMEAQGKEWDRHLTEWGAKADKAAANVKAEFHTWHKEFRVKRGEAYKKIHAVKAAKDDAWEGMKAGAETTWTEVKSAFEDAKKKYS